MSDQQRMPLNPLYAYVGAFVDELARSGVRHAVVCPGSRSTPLALALASEPRIRVWMQIDERSAGFFALGMAKRLQEPVVLVCTSGTAAANFFPAIVEANLTHVPLLVLTADRPPELRDNGAPQTIDQNRLYGAHVTWYAETALPEATNAALRYIRTIACRAVVTARAQPNGPVHLNMPFREPLTPDPQTLPPIEQRDPVAWEGRADDQPYVEVPTSSPANYSPAEITSTADRLAGSDCGVIIVGSHTDPALSNAILVLARRLDYPILADPLANLRGDDDVVIASYDAFLRDDRFVNAAAPAIILRFGAMPTSKPLLQYMKHYPDCPHIAITGNGSWDDPTQLASAMIHTAPAAFCRAVVADLAYRHPEKLTESAHQSSWLARWQHAEAATQAGLCDVLMGFTDTFEGRVFSELGTFLPNKSQLFVSNSMPVRDCDTFFWPLRDVHVFGNRGANGIDGITSTALGIAAADLTTPTVLVIGDLAFYHDLNGLLAAKLYDLNLTIVLVNNDGGGIFSFLPQASYPEHFEQVFGTPTDLDFAPIVAMYGGSFTQMVSWEQFSTFLTRGIARGGLNVIEVRTNRASNVTMHRELWQAMSAALVEQGVVPAGEAQP